MFSALLAIATAIWYFKTAHNVGKNAWLWAALGFIACQGAFTALTKLIIFPVSLFTPSIHNNSLFNSVLWAIVLALTAVVVMYVRRNYLLKGQLVVRD